MMKTRLIVERFNHEGLYQLQNWRMEDGLEKGTTGVIGLKYSNHRAGVLTGDDDQKKNEDNSNKIKL